MENQNELHDDTMCGAKTRAGTPCQQRAGWGTNHVGEGRCKLHGGRSTGPRDKSKLKKNNNAEKHGLFSKYLPKETMDLVNGMEDLNPIDILWDNIKVQYAAIIRSQQIMYVRDEEDNNAATAEGAGLTANEKQSNFLQSQSRAMNTLAKMIKDYEDLCKSNMATEQQKQRIEQVKANTEYTKEKIKLLKGGKVDLTMAESMIQMLEKGEGG